VNKYKKGDKANFAVDASAKENREKENERKRVFCFSFANEKKNVDITKARLFLLSSEKRNEKCRTPLLRLILRQ